MNNLLKGIITFFVFTLLVKSTVGQVKNGSKNNMSDSIILSKFLVDSSHNFKIYYNDNNANNNSALDTKNVLYSIISKNQKSLDNVSNTAFIVDNKFFFLLTM